MPGISLTPKLREEYQRLFDTCSINPARSDEVNRLVKAIVQNRNRYAAVGDPLGIPWYFVGVVHNMECSLNFSLHLHNGDKLTARTSREPPGRPKSGSPPFTWEESATDALIYDRVDKMKDWSIPSILFKLEGYNGYGYRMYYPHVLSPYLWSFTSHYKKGKYKEDGKWSADLVSQQCGAAALLRRMAENGDIQFNAEGLPLHGAVNTEESVDPLAASEPMVVYSMKAKSALAEQLQKALNLFPGIFLDPDGVPGKDTSDALRKVTGSYLKGDPRA